MPSQPLWLYQGKAQTKLGHSVNGPHLKGLAHADLAKNKNKIAWFFLLFYVQIFCSINFCFGPFEIYQFKTNCSVLKFDWESPHMVQLFTECCVSCHYILLFYTCFCRFGLQTLDSGLVSTPNLLRPNNLLGDLIDGCVNNFMFFFE